MEDLPKNCRICIKAKKAKLQRHTAATRASQPLERVYMDYWGPYRRGSITGDEYILTITDDCTRYGWVFPIKDRTSKMLKAVFSKWKEQVERQTGKKIKKVRLDNSEEFKSLADEVGNDGILFEFITPYAHEQNGVAERMNRTLITIMRALIFESKVSKNLWAFAAEAACYIRNRSVMVRPVDGSSEEMRMTPYKLWTGNKLRIDHMKVWGCEAWVHVSLEKDADKLNPHAVEGIFIGYTEDPSQYLV